LNINISTTTAAAATFHLCSYKHQIREAIRNRQHSQVSQECKSLRMQFFSACPWPFDPK